MQRPANEVDLTNAPKTITTCRRLLSYLLRATRLQIDRDKIGQGRFASLSAELSDALIPLVVSERSALGFYRALCARFSVDPTGGDGNWGPIEAWLPDGRIRWDRALASLDYAHMRLVIHENPAFLSTFAFSSPCDGEDSIFSSFPEPAAVGAYRPTLPGMLIAPRSYRTVWTLVSPMAHGADEKSGNVNLFRRHRVVNPLTGEQAYVPFMAGNAVRGMWRDMVMARWLALIGLKPTDLPAERVHALFAGGSVEAGADGAGVNLAVRKRARELCPPWDLVAGCTDQQIMSGRARVHDAVLFCRENAWLVHAALGRADDLVEFAAALPHASELTQLRLGTRHAHRDYAGSDGTQMIFNQELVIGGAQMLHSLQVYGVDGVETTTASCLADLLNDFREYGTVGAANARGLGLIAFDSYQPGDGAPPLPDPAIYLEYVEKRRDDMRAWALRQNEPAPPIKPMKGGKGKPSRPVAPLADHGPDPAEGVL